jgi:transcriptional regulator with XRE-family HTH domain
METIYDRIRKRREELGLTQEDLAKKMGYKSRTSINKIEQGKNDLPTSKIVEFAAALDTTIDYLMGWEWEDTKKHYSNPETAEAAQMLSENEGLRVLFDTVKDLPPENLKAITELIKNFKK